MATEISQIVQGETFTTYKASSRYVQEEPYEVLRRIGRSANVVLYKGMVLYPTGMADDEGMGISDCRVPEGLDVTMSIDELTISGKDFSDDQLVTSLKKAMNQRLLGTEGLDDPQCQGDVSILLEVASAYFGIDATKEDLRRIYDS